MGSVGLSQAFTSRCAAALLLAVLALRGVDGAVCWVTPDAKGHAVIPAGTTSIPGNAFYSCSKLVSVVIPSSVTSIDDSAFSGCSNLASVVIPFSVTSIGADAFGDCRTLVTVVIPSSVTSIGVAAFAGCRSLSPVVIPSSVTSIGFSAFQYCSSVASVVIPSSVTSVDESTFQGCSSLTSITIPSAVTSIGANAFQDCSSLNDIVFNGTVASIDPTAFNGVALKQVTIPIKSTSVGGLRGFPSFGITCDLIKLCMCIAGYNAQITGTMLTCSQCAPGTYKKDPSNVACSSCIPGKFMAVYKTGSTTESDCQPCPEGTYSFSAGGYICSPCNPGSNSSLAGASACELCSPGRYGDRFGMQQCLDCPVGKVTLGPGALSCVEPSSGSCPLGQFSASGLPLCSSCETGKYSSRAASTRCEPCSAGKVAMGAGQALCVQCPPTEYARRAMECVSCPAGHQPSEDQTSCTMCARGQFSQKTTYLSAGYLSCQSCPAGFFSATPGATECTACPPASFGPHSGASACSPCAQGYSQALAGQSLCVAVAVAASSNAALSGILANQGTPFYIIAIACLLLGAFGIFINYCKMALNSTLYVPSVLRIVGDTIMFAGAAGSELVLASGLLGSTSAPLRSFGMLLVISRTCLGAFPALLVLYDLSRGDGHSKLKPLLLASFLFENSKAFGLLLALAMLEGRLLAHLPWLRSDFTEASRGYPRLSLLRLVGVFSLLQLTATFVAQIGTLVTEHRTSSDALLAVLLLNVSFSSCKLAVSLLDVFLQFHALAPSRASMAARHQKGSLAGAISSVSMSANVSGAGSKVGSSKVGGSGVGPEDVDVELTWPRLRPGQTRPPSPSVLEAVESPLTAGAARALVGGPLRESRASREGSDADFIPPLVQRPASGGRLPNPGGSERGVADL